MKSLGLSKSEFSFHLHVLICGLRLRRLFFVFHTFLSNREKKLLVSSEDYGRDLTGVQNLRKKHKRLEAELGAHEPAIQVEEGLPVIQRIPCFVY